MQLNRIGDIKPYDAPGHFDVETLRMQGLGASDAKNFSVGLSHFEPGRRLRPVGLPAGESLCGRLRRADGDLR